MRRVPGFLAALLLLTALAGCLAPTGQDGDDPPAPALREVWFSHVQDPAEAYREALRLGRLDGVHVDEIGTSREARPMQAVTIGEGPFVLWSMGRLHGNEPSGMQAILLIMELLAAPDVTVPAHAPTILHDLVAHRDLLKERITFVFVPVGNPDGAAAYQRGSSMGVDLNRDFFAFTQEESQVIREAFWNVWPDGCLDLHNIGPSENDFEAYGPTGPLLEEETERLFVRDSWFAVHEVDAQGGRASGMNEDYRAPEPAEEYPWPEAYHPGTHDFFCSARGAPGWTPEGSITSGDNGATDPVFEWAARQHAVTIAASAFHWSGVYDGVAPFTVKSERESSSSAAHEVEVPAQGVGEPLRLQAVWRPEVVAHADHVLVPVQVRVTDPAGAVQETTSATYHWSATFVFPAALAGTYRVEVTPATILPLVPLQSEVRAYGAVPLVELADVERVAQGLRVTASGDASETVTVVLTDVAAAQAWDDAVFSAQPFAVTELRGTVQERAVAQWRLDLEPGEELLIEVEGLKDTRPGPFRFTATSGDAVYMGVATEPRVAR